MLSYIKDLISKGALYASFIFLGKKIKENEVMQKTIEKQQKNLKLATASSLSWDALLEWMHRK